MQGTIVFRNFKFALCAAVAAVSASAFSAVDPENYTITGFKFFSASPGETNVYSGVLSGTGYAIVEGGGTVAFTNPNNTYSGGTLVSNAVFRLDANGCAGSGAITAAVNKAHIFMNCANVPNDLYFAEGYSTDKTNLQVGEYPPDNALPLFPLVSSVTVSGKVYFNKTSRYVPGSSKISAARTVTFENDFETASKADVSIYTYGTTIFNGKLTEAYTGSNTGIGGASSAKGSVVFNSASNKVTKLSTYNANFTFNAKDTLPETLFYFCYGSTGNYSIYDFNGNDQTFAGVIWSYGDSHPSPSETSAGHRFRTTEGHPATVRFTGSNTYTPSTATAPYKNRLALSGPLTLVMDILPASTTKGFFQEFSVRKSETTGDLVISNGDFRVTEGASFPNVPNIYVGSGGTFSSAATTNAFAGCRSLVVDGTMAFGNDVKTPFTDGKVALSLGSSANLTLPSGYTLTVPSLKVGGEIKADGTYGDGGLALAQISRGTVIVRSSDRYVDCNTADTVNDGSKAHPYKTIRAATDNALSGDVIHVAPGTYGASEGLPQKATEASKIGTRVVIPEDVTIESTDGPEVTFIVGAAAYDDQIDNATYGTGTNAVRCVYAKDGAVLRGFTLTGGRAIGVLAGDGGSWTIDHASAAFRAASSLGATIENCVVSNNIAYVGTIYNAVVKNCIVVGNRCLRGGTGAVSPAGYQCGWYGSIIDGNYGHCTIYAAAAVENCTIGSGNKDTAGTGLPQVLYWYGGGDHAVINTAILGGRFYMGGTAVICCTNCLLVDDSYLHATMRARAYNCIITNSAAMQVEAKTYRPKLGSFAGIDAGEAAYSSDALGDKDFYGTPRVLNGAIDIGAVEYDWRPKFSTELGKRFTVTWASPSVTTNASGGLVMDGGQGASDLQCVAGTVSNAGSYELAFSLTGGSLVVYVGDALVKESSGLGDQMVAFRVSDATQEIRFVFTPDASDTPGAAVLKQIASARGFSIDFR